MIRLLRQEAWKIDDTKLRELLIALQSGSLAVDEALERLRRLPYENLGFAEVDHHRAVRKGFPEVILGESKTDEQLVAIAGHSDRRLAQSRASRQARASPFWMASVSPRSPGK